MGLSAVAFCGCTTTDQETAGANLPPGQEVVIAESSIHFLRPVRKTIRAICCRPEDSALTTLKSELAANNRGRIRLRVRVEESGASAAEFEGLFAAIRSE